MSVSDLWCTEHFRFKGREAEQQKSGEVVDRRSARMQSVGDDKYLSKLTLRVKHRNIKQAICSRCEVRNRMLDEGNDVGNPPLIYVPSPFALGCMRSCALHVIGSSYAELCSTRGSFVVCGAMLYARFVRHMRSYAPRVVRVWSYVLHLVL